MYQNINEKCKWILLTIILYVVEFLVCICCILFYQLSQHRHFPWIPYCAAENFAPLASPASVFMFVQKLCSTRQTRNSLDAYIRTCFVNYESRRRKGISQLLLCASLNHFGKWILRIENRIHNREWFIYGLRLWLREIDKRIESRDCIFE